MLIINFRYTLRQWHLSPAQFPSVSLPVTSNKTTENQYCWISTNTDKSTLKAFTIKEQCILQLVKLRIPDTSLSNGSMQELEREIYHAQKNSMLHLNIA